MSKKKIYTKLRVPGILATLAFLLIGLPESYAQENVITVGLQVRPMIPFRFIGTAPEMQESEGFESTLYPKFGMNMGMVIRKGLSPMWSIETGINFVQRNYSMDISHPQMRENIEMNYRFISYEIPVQGLVYVKLGDQLFMNASGGLSFDFYPSNVESFANTRRDTLSFDFHQKTVRNGWLQFGLIANYGFEWRTKSKGYYYLGVSYKRPFRIIGASFLTAELNRDPAEMEHFIKGEYLTLDLRYFFNEKPKRNRL